MNGGSLETFLLSQLECRTVGRLDSVLPSIGEYVSSLLTCLCVVYVLFICCLFVVYLLFICWFICSFSYPHWVWSLPLDFW